MWIHIRWPADLDLQCFQKRIYPGSAGQELKSNTETRFSQDFTQIVLLTSRFICIDCVLSDQLQMKLDCFGTQGKKNINSQ